MSETPNEPDDGPDAGHDEYEPPEPRRHAVASGRRLAVAGVAALVLLGGGAALALRGGGGGGGGASSDGDDLSTQEDAALEFANCMRDNGLEGFPDPEVDPDGGVSFSGLGQEVVDSEEFRAAEEVCQPIMEAVAPSPEGAERLTPEEHAELQDRWLAAAQCVRDQGFDFADPEIDEYGRFRHVDAVGDGIEQAIEECLVEAGVPDEGGPEGEEEA